MLKRQSHAILYRIARFYSQTLMSAYTDPLFVRSLHTRSIGNRLDADIVNRINPIEIYSNSTGANGLFKVIKGGNPIGLTLTSCFDSHKKAQALAQHRRLLRGLGSGPREERGAGTTDLADGRGAYLRSNTTRFQGTDKIAVAVDIDEVLGNFVSALNRFIADRYLSNHSVSEYHVYEFFRFMRSYDGMNG